MSSSERTPLLPTHRFDLPSSSRATDSLGLPKDSTPLQIAKWIAALRASKLPSTDQLNAVFDLVLSSDLLSIDQLHEANEERGPTYERGYGAARAAEVAKKGKVKGRKAEERERAVEGLLKEVRGFIESWRDLIKDKDYDDALQDLAYHSAQAGVRPTANLVAVNVDTELPSDISTLVSAFSTLLVLIPTHAQTASLLALDELLLILGDFFADTLSETSNVIGDVSQTVRIDLKAHPSPKLEEKHELMGAGVASGVDGDLKAEGKTGIGAQAKERVKGERDDAKETLNEDMKQVVKDVVEGEERLEEKVKEIAEKDVRDAAVERLQRLISHIQTDPSFRSSLQTLLDLARKYGPSRSTSASPPASPSNDPTLSSLLLPRPSAPHPTPTQDHLSSTLTSLETLLSRLAHRPLTPLLSSIQRLLHLLRTSPPATHAYLVALSDYTQRIIDEPAWARSRGASRRAEQLYDQGREVLREDAEGKGREGGITMGGEWRTIVNELQAIVKGVRDDENLKAIASSAQSTLSTFVSPPTPPSIAGETAHKAPASSRPAVALLGSAWSWTTSTAFLAFQRAIPTLGTILKQIPIPRVEASTPTVDFLLDDLILESLSFIPDSMHLEAKIGIDIIPPSHPPEGPSKGKKVVKKVASKIGVADDPDERDKTKLRFKIEGLRLSLHNLSFFVRIKSAFLPVLNTHTGLLDLDLTGTDGPGVEAEVEVILEDADPPPYPTGDDSTATRDGPPLFTVKSVDISLPRFTFRIRKSNHRILIFLLRPLVVGVVRVVARSALSSVMKTQLERVGNWGGEVSREVGKRRRERGEEGAWPVVRTMVGVMVEGKPKDETVIDVEEEEKDADDDDDEEEDEGQRAQIHVSSQAIVRSGPDHSLDLAIGLPSMAVPSSPPKPLAKLTSVSPSASSPTPATDAPGILPSLEHDQGPEPSSARIARQAGEAAEEAEEAAKEVGEEVREIERAVVVAMDPEGEMRDRVRKQGKGKGKGRKKEEEGWRSSVFDLV